MEECNDFVVIDDDSAKSPEKAIQKLYLLIDTFQSSINSLNQSNILLKDELRQALDVTLQNIKPEPASDFSELFNALESKLISPDDIRQNYNKHLLARLVSVNLQNQELQREIEDQKNANESRNTMLSLKLQQASSSLNVIQSVLGIVGYTSSHDGDVAPRFGNLETTGHPTCVDQSGGDTKQDEEPVHDENGSPSDEDISATLTDLCNRLSAVQMCLIQAVPHGSNPTVRSSGQTQPEECVETSSFFTVDDQLSGQPYSAISSSSITPNLPPANNDEVNLMQQQEVTVPLEATRSSPSGDASRRGQEEAVLQTTLKDVASQCEKPDPVAKPVVSSEQTNTASSVALEAACQWVDTPPTRLIAGNQPVIPQASTSNTMAKHRTLEAPGNRTITPQGWSSNAMGSLTEHPIGENRPIIPEESGSNTSVRCLSVRNLSPDLRTRFELRSPAPTFSADEEIPLCPCCQNLFTSRLDLEDHLSYMDKPQRR